MPGKDAGEVFEMLRNNPDMADVKICVITGRPELRQTIYDRSVTPPDGYLDKPVDEERLMVNVRKILAIPHEHG
jgi:CheY-like chemotaxis protein